MAGISLSDILSLCNRPPEQHGGCQWVDMFPVPLHCLSSIISHRIYTCRFNALVNIYVLRY